MGNLTNPGKNETMLPENCICITRVPCETHRQENVNVNKCCLDDAAEVIDQINGRTQPWWCVIPVIWCAVISACLCSAEIGI